MCFRNFIFIIHFKTEIQNYESDRMGEVFDQTPEMTDFWLFISTPFVVDWTDFKLSKYQTDRFISFNTGTYLQPYWKWIFLGQCHLWKWKKVLKFNAFFFTSQLLQSFSASDCFINCKMINSFLFHYPIIFSLFFWSVILYLMHYI